MSEEMKPPTLWQVAKSVLAAMLGVQKSESYQRDFQYGKPRQYIILGLTFVTLFILIIVGVVKLILSLTGV